MNNPSISPEALALLVSGYVLNDLSPEEAQQLKTLRQDPAVAQTIDKLIAQTEASLEATYLPAEVSPPPQLRGSILTALAEINAKAAESVVPPAASPVEVPLLEVVHGSVGLPRWAKVVGALAAAAIAALICSNYWLWRSLQNQSQLLQAAVQSEETVRSSLRQVALQPTGGFSQVATETTPVAVTVDLDADALSGTLTIENLPPLEPGQVYVLWTVLTPEAPFTTDDKGAILTHVFTVEADGKQSQPLTLPQAFQTAPEFVQAVAITVENATAPQSHEASPILIQQL